MITPTVQTVENQLPKRPGITEQKLDERGQELPSHVLPYKATMTDLSNEVVFFSHAALFVYGNWTRDPVADYVNTEDTTCDPFWITFDKPIFSGLFCRGPGKRTYQEWNYRLMACPVDKWSGLLSYLQTLAGINYLDQRYHTTVVQKLPMVDHMALSRKATLPSPLPMVDIYAVGLLGNDRNVYFEPANNPPIDKVRIRIGPPLPHIIQQAEEILKDKTNAVTMPIMIPLGEENGESNVLDAVCDR